MKIPVDHIDLTEMGYEGYFIEMPRSVKEGYLHEFAKLSNPVVNADGTDGDNTEASRITNIKVMELVTAWNIDDDDGKVLPLLSKVKTKAERERVIAEIPVDLIVHVAERIAGNVKVPEKTQDF